MTKPLILVDGSSYLYRAFHALPSLTNSKGRATGAIYGVINMLRKLLADYSPEMIAVVFDAKGKTFRDELYAQYKAHRTPMPDALSEQIPAIHAIIEALGIPIVTISGVEADDVIGTLATDAAKQNLATLISTGDKDFAQLVTPQITLMNTMTGTFLTEETVQEKFGLPPRLIIDYLALVGDSIDNIPGVPLVGPKTAVKWLQTYGSAEGVIAHAGEIKGKVGANLAAGLAQIPLSKMLATIKCDVPLTFKFSDLKKTAPDTSKLIEFYKEFEFKNWLNELLESEIPKTRNANYQLILNEAAFQLFLEQLKLKNLFAFGTETSHTNYFDADIIGLAFALSPGEAFYIPFSHQYENAPPQLEREYVLQQLKTILESKTIKKIGHHLKYDCKILARYGINLQGLEYDTMLVSYILDSAASMHALETLALKYLGWRTISYESLTGKGAKQMAFMQVPLEKASQYAAEDVDVSLHLYHQLWPRLEKEPGLKYVFEKIETPLLHVLSRIERQGVLIDCEKLEKQNLFLENRLELYSQQITTHAGCTFNINSPKQLQEILFNQLKLPVLQKTPTGQPSTADPVLQELALEYELPKYIIEYRTISKLITTYTKKLPEQIHPQTKRIHTSYNQTGASTGRLSSSEPNLQNIPIRTEEGRRIREAFVVPKGYKMIAADYSQIELRIMAHISEDPNLLKAFSENLDIHTATAAEILNIPLEQVSDDERRKAKAINFGLIYGMSAFGLAKQIGASRDAAQLYIERYFARYPNVLDYMEKTRTLAHERGYVETLWGRRLYLPDINSSQFMRQKAAERTAINAPLQGSAADIIKKAMISIDDWIETHAVDAKIIMQVHDELVFEVADKDVEIMLEIIRTHMMQAAALKVPLLVSIGVGENWNEASEAAST
jgi:DNA polymerase-1